MAAYSINPVTSEKSSGERTRHTPSTPSVSKERNHLLDFLRIVFATAVIFSHAPENVDGSRARDPFNALTHSGLSLGDVAVDGFFLLSGYLIVLSWQRDPRLFDFVQKRLLRIVPGYLVAFVLSTVVVGLSAPGIPHFFTHFDREFPLSLLLLSDPKTPPVFPGLCFAAVNTPLWTIAYEFRCYLLVALFGLPGLLNRRWTWLLVTLLCLLLHAIPTLGHAFSWHRYLLLTGEPERVFRLAAAFGIGGCFLLFRDRIPYRPVLALAAGASLLATEVLLRAQLEAAIFVSGGYLLFYAAQLRPRSFRFMRSVPDISYGVYLYGWPLECLWIFFWHGSPWIAAACATTISYLLGWLSWHFVERPMLQLKRRPMSPLPPG